MRVAVLGVDLGKNVCSLVGLNTSGAVVLRRRAKRETVIALTAKLSRCIVGMEALNWTRAAGPSEAGS
jgi:transposase